MTVFASILHNIARDVVKRRHAPQRCDADDATGRSETSAIPLHESTRGHGRVKRAGAHGKEPSQWRRRRRRLPRRSPRRRRATAEQVVGLAPSGAFRPGETEFRQPLPVFLDCLPRVRRVASCGMPVLQLGILLSLRRDKSRAVPRSDEKGRPGPLGARAGLIFCPAFGSERLFFGC